MFQSNVETTHLFPHVTRLLFSNFWIISHYHRLELFEMKHFPQHRIVLVY